MVTPVQLINQLRDLPAVVRKTDYRRCGYHLDVELTPEKVRGFAAIVREHRFYLVFVSAVHTAPVIEITYQFAGYAVPCRIIGRAPVAADGTIPTIADIFDGANWHERETRDMFGVVFTGHPCLEPLLLPEDAADLNPLLKKDDAVKNADAIRRPAEQRSERGEEQSGDQ